ncbi:MAG TPA: hypothetical protein VGG51_14475 [Candidatus Cybelea sp.]|jgi:hypothetical protein
MKGKLFTGFYRVQVSGSAATIVGSTKLVGGCASTGHTSIIQPWIHGSFVVGGNTFCSQDFGYWAYPQGRRERKTIKQAVAPYAGDGAAVSVPADGNE